MKLVRLLICWVLTISLPVGADLGASAAALVGSPILAPGYGQLDFAPPPPGSYRLPPIAPAADGIVRGADGAPVRLHALYAGKYVILSFIYSSCDDLNGCPLSTFVLYRLYQAMQQDPELAQQLRLLSLSFDPRNDTPAAMRLYGANFPEAAGQWQFLTTASEDELAPILRDYDQGISRVYDAQGRYTGQISHVLRVFLIDPQQQIRNIYSVSFLHPDLVLADVRTLLREAAGSGGDTPIATAPEVRTRELLTQAAHPPLGLPPMPAAVVQSLSAAKVDLGRKLFFDRRLSANGTLSCALCHRPQQGFTHHAMARAVGVEGRSLRRNAASLYNLAWSDPLFVDGREHTLETLVWMELLDLDRLGNRSVAVVLDRLRAAPDYQGRFEAAFPGRAADMVTVAAALAAYLRTLVSANSAFDRGYFGGEAGALTPAAERGFELFRGKAGCAGCHILAERYALFTDQQMHDTGIGWQHSMRREPARRVLEPAPGVRIEVDLAALTGTAERPYNDLGRYEVTQDPADRWRFRTPSLRNVANTAPYMHDGSLPTLAAVVEYYDRGGHAHPGLDPRLRPLGLTEPERADLVVFLEALTGDNLALFDADAAAALGEPVAAEWRP
ncbi:MAG: cytochrome c peroxidase [Thiotrichales bacterium]